MSDDKIIEEGNIEGVPHSANRWRKSLRWEILPLGFVALVLIAALVPSAFTSADPFAQALSNRFAPPMSPGHPFGTDGLGRDILARIIYGARATVIVVVLALGIGAMLGTVIGLIAGLVGGVVDSILMRLTDMMLSMPIILFALVLVFLLGPSLTNLTIAIGGLAWARYARVVRSEALVIAVQDYVAVARLSGASQTRILTRHIFPNTVPTVLVLVTLQVGWVVIVESGLSFLGAGVPPPDPSWGGMISEGRAVMLSAWWVSVLPGVVIMLLVTSMNIIGDRIRDRTDPSLAR